MLELFTWDHYELVYTTEILAIVRFLLMSCSNSTRSCEVIFWTEMNWILMGTNIKFQEWKLCHFNFLDTKIIFLFCTYWLIWHKSQIAYRCSLEFSVVCYWRRCLIICRQTHFSNCNLFHSRNYFSHTFLRVSFNILTQICVSV